jgi:hypothetical protein
MLLLRVRSRRRTTAPWWALAAAACGLAAGLVSCTGERERNGEPDTQATSPEHGSPRLTKPVTQYTAAEFQRLVSELYFGGAAVDSGTVFDTTASGAPGGAQLMIEAMSVANRVDLNDVGDYGTILARLRNLGGGNDPTFGTTPGASHEYYIIVTPGTKADTAAFAVVGITRGPHPTMLSPGNNGSIAPCAKDEPAAPYSSARFGGCLHRDSASGPERTSFLGVRTLSAQGRGSAWVSCSAGCCELGVAQTASQ